jgi:hypothetical protein
MMLAFGLLLAGLAATRPAQAGFVLSGSLGYGHELHPRFSEQATTLMVTPGYALLADIVRLELGILAGYGAVVGGLKNGFDLEFRPMVRISPPLIPLYARLIVAGVDLTTSRRAVAYGGALGVGLSLLGVGVFGELGVLPRHVAHRFHWIGEARAGVSYAF